MCMVVLRCCGCGDFHFCNMHVFVDRQISVEQRSLAAHLLSGQRTGRLHTVMTLLCNGCVETC